MATDYFYTLERPLHELPERSQVRAANLQGFVELVDSLDGDPRKLLQEYGIEPALVEAGSGFIDCQSVVDLLEHCAVRFSEPLFGIRLAQFQEPDIYGGVAALCRSAPDIREAIRCLVDYVPVVHSSESVLELVESSHVAEFRWSVRSDLGVNDQANCHGLLLNLKLLRAIGGAGFAPRYVSLPLEVSREVAADIEKAMACEVRVNRKHACIAFPARSLDTPVIGADLPLFQLLSGYMSRLKEAASPTLVDKVGDFVHRALGYEEVSIEVCAGKLGLSTRTLQIRLRQAGVSFSGILEQQRLERARRILVHSELSVAEIADLLGYSERTSFGRAFKRWTGVSPQQFRQQACG